MNSQLYQRLWFDLGANRLPYEIPLHPNLVHLTLGLFIIAIIFDIAGTFFPLEKPILKFLSLTAIRSGFYDVGWYNMLACAVITPLTVAAGFFELVLADPPPGVTSDWGLSPGETMLLHGLGGILLLAIIFAMTGWRGLQRYRWRKNKVRQVQWLYLLAGIALLGILYVHGTLGGHLGSEFGVHNTAAHLLREGKNPNTLLE
ncbi:MAG: DUF2231 domain-containing protein [Scytonema sp. PMC 1069.18]|nr:DUF2231 domain-containing protein [Scytonema sp. PMC 1069.18]MEC4886653.1 DUF2231 domain-containing protein [Scytonema sp. PMC 1070.18]